MSEVVEKEGAASAFFSVLSSWLGLGAGLAILLASFLAVLGATYPNDPNRSLLIRLDEQLAVELACADLSELTVTDDGSSLSFLKSEGGARLPVFYTFSPDEGLLFREVTGEQKTKIGATEELKFSLDEKFLTVRSKSGDKATERRWARSRWGTP